jgi:hypothetical protein
MENRNTLAAAFAAMSQQKMSGTACPTQPVAAIPDAGVPLRPRPEQPRFDDEVLLAALRQSAGPCDRIFATRIAGLIGAIGER